MSGWRENTVSDIVVTVAAPGFCFGGTLFVLNVVKYKIP